MDDEAAALDRMTAAAERWLVAMAGGADRSSAEAGIDTARTDFRRAERKRRKGERRHSAIPPVPPIKNY